MSRSPGRLAKINAIIIVVTIAIMVIAAVIAKLTVKPLPKIEPMELVQQATPFDHDDWLFQLNAHGVTDLAEQCCIVAKLCDEYVVSIHAR